MSRDVLDYVRARLLEQQPQLVGSVDSILLDARREYGGERHYVRCPDKSRHVVERDTRQILPYFCRRASDILGA